jgi:uncharacterized protein (DUF2384 family)
LRQGSPWRAEKSARSKALAADVSGNKRHSTDARGWLARPLFGVMQRDSNLLRAGSGRTVINQLKAMEVNTANATALPKPIDAR